ncbi:hypothetical protein OSTOST_21171 [Ostertagia ostertagi]
MAYLYVDYQKKGRFDENRTGDGSIWSRAKLSLGLLGTEMDYITDKLSSEFVFRNPNIKGTCGCGESFQFMTACAKLVLSVYLTICDLRRVGRYALS